MFYDLSQLKYKWFFCTSNPKTLTCVTTIRIFNYVFSNLNIVNFGSFTYQMWFAADSKMCIGKYNTKKIGRQKFRFFNGFSDRYAEHLEGTANKTFVSGCEAQCKYWAQKVPNRETHWLRAASNPASRGQLRAFLS